MNATHSYTATICLVCFVLAWGIAGDVKGNVIDSTVVESFDSGLNGWRFAPPTDSSTLNWSATIGNPAGSAYFQDSAGGTAGRLRAPERFLGDWSLVREIRYDHKIIATGTAATIGTLEMSISGPNGAARYSSPVTPAVSHFVTVAAPLVESQWTLLSGTWAGLITDVYVLDLDIEAVANNNNNAFVPRDKDSVDNIMLVVGLSGDFTGNGLVDASDYTLWKQQFGSVGDFAADGNGDGVVDAADYTVWRDNIGSTILPDASAASHTAVPEPSAMVLLGIAGAVLGARRKKRSCRDLSRR